MRSTIIVRAVRGLLRNKSRVRTRGRLEAGKAAAEGDAARDRGAWATAAAAYKRAVELRADWAPIHVQLGNMLKESGDLEAAEKAYRTALTIDNSASDTYLQLGHALKLQSRHEEARQAYFEAVVRDPSSTVIRTELRHYGVSETAVKQFVAAHTWSAADVAPHVTVTDRRSVSRQQPPALSGYVTTVGPNFVEGQLCNVWPESLPVILVARENGSVSATLVIEDENAISAEHRLSFRFSFDIAPSSPLHLSIDPPGIPIAGTPLLLPNPEGAGVLARLSLLEAEVARLGSLDSLASGLERQLSSRLIGNAASTIERMFRYQRQQFERQLLQLQGGAPKQELTTALPHSDVPEKLRFRASDTFPGIGWEAVTVGPDGICSARISDRAYVTARLKRGSGVVLEMVVSGIHDRSVIERISIGAYGCWVPFWAHYEPANGDGRWTIRTLISSPVFAESGEVRCHIDCPTAAAIGQHEGGLLVQTLTLQSIPEAQALDLLFSGPGWWAIGGLDFDARRVASAPSIALVVPPIQTSLDTQVEILLSALPLTPELRLNGRSIIVEADGTTLRAKAEGRLWSSSAPNVLELATFSTDDSQAVEEFISLRVSADPVVKVPA